jgi:hypothetical protein
MPGEETTTSTIARAAAQAAPTFIAWAYQWMSRMACYTAEDKSRYDKLVRYYNAMHTGATLPEHWKLEDRGKGQYAPTYEYSFAEEGHGIMRRFDSLRMSPASACLSARAILSTVIKLFDSLAKRTINKLRQGSVEGMFFVELTEWVMQTLPTLRFDNEADLLILKRRRTYCETILEQVLVPDAGVRAGERNHPMLALAEVIINLDALIESTNDVIHSMTFNDHGRQLNDHLLHMIANTLQILRHMIDGDHDAELEFPIPLFLSDRTDHRHSISDLKRKRLGTWLLETFKAAGIVDNSLADTKTISLDGVARHLDGECFDDAICHLPPALKSNPKHADWGYWDFVCNSELDISTLSSGIRDIHRGILNLFILRHAVSHLLKTAPVYGEAWLYKDEVGISMLNDLMSVTDRLALALSQSLDAVYRPLITLYDQKESAGAIKASSHCFNAMRRMKEIYRSFGENKESLSGEIEAIKTAATKIDRRIAEADESKYAVLRFLVDFIEHTYDEAALSASGLHYPLLRRALDDFKSTVQMPTIESPAHGGAGRERTTASVLLEEARQRAAESRYAAIIGRITPFSAPHTSPSEDDDPHNETQPIRRADMPRPPHPTTGSSATPAASAASAAPGAASSALTAKEAAALEKIEGMIARCHEDIEKLKRKEAVSLPALSLGKLSLPSGSLSREIYSRVLREYQSIAEYSAWRLLSGYYGKDSKLVQRYLGGFISILETIAKNCDAKRAKGGLSDKFLADTDRHLRLLLLEMVGDLPRMHAAVMLASEMSIVRIEDLETKAAASDTEIIALKRELAEDRAKIDTLERERAEDRAKIDTLERERAEDRAAIALLQSQMAALLAAAQTAAATTASVPAAGAAVPAATAGLGRLSGLRARLFQAAGTDATAGVDVAAAAGAGAGAQVRR